MQLRNTGTVMAEWSFVPKNDNIEVSKSWLKFSPMEGILAPDETCDVEVLVMLNLEEAYEIATTKANVRTALLLSALYSEMFHSYLTVFPLSSLFLQTFLFSWSTISLFCASPTAATCSAS